jgi:GTP-binding protein
MPLPVIAIVGRPNVGKSSLLNALVGKTISIVQDQPGVTRDRVSALLSVDGRFVDLVDTGGYGFEDPDELTDHIRHQIDLAMARCDLVLFLVDIQAGLTSGDEQIAGLLRSKGLRAVLVANKTDGTTADPGLGDFARLGMGTPIGVSALSGRNLDQVMAAIQDRVDLSQAPTRMPEPQMMLAIVGKRNAGKSTLVNAVAKLYEADSERVIVSEVPGTTRDSVDVRFEKDGQTLIVIDTAGVRKKRRMVTDDVAFYSMHRAQRSIRRADVVVMLVDGTEHLSEPDKKLAQYIAEQRKPVIIAINKWDLVLQGAHKQAEERGTSFSSELLMKEFGEYIGQELTWLDYAPLAFLTARDGRNVQALLDLAQHLNKQAHERVGTGRLNAAVKRVFQERVPSTPRGQRVKVYYATQVDVAPPTIVLFVNNPDNVSESYQRFVVNRFRELLPYPEVPIKLVIRGRQAAAATDDEPATRPPHRTASPHVKAKRPAGPRRPQAHRPRR